MIKRKDENAAFHTSPAGIRDFFDVSCIFGATGIGITFLEAAMNHYRQSGYIGRR